MTIEIGRGVTSQLKRRGFLAALGGTGVGAAVAVFGGAASAEALVSYGCCTLAFKNSGNLSYCESKSHYIWDCGYGGGDVYCSCCEVKNSSGAYIRSDAGCFESG
ncbi:MAG: hypothetical protein M3Y42_04065 [Actinomycetota bacterium]|nr:hypothetical protein [Actinomycetota bacterium]